MRSRRREDAWNQEDTVEVLVTEDVDDDQDVRETARRIVNDSHAMAANDRRRHHSIRACPDEFWFSLLFNSSCDNVKIRT